MTLDEAIMKYKSNAEYEREHGSPAYLKSEQLCKWLEELRALKEQQRPKGHWIEGQTDNPNIHNILCSCCCEGYPSKGHANSQYTREKFKYCPNCGARMIEPQESEE